MYLSLCLWAGNEALTDAKQLHVAGGGLSDVRQAGPRTPLAGCKGACYLRLREALVFVCGTQVFPWCCPISPFPPKRLYREKLTLRPSAAVAPVYLLDLSEPLVVVQVPVTIGGVEISPGDVIFGDDDGVVVLGNDLAKIQVVSATLSLSHEDCLPYTNTCDEPQKTMLPQAIGGYIRR